MKIINLRLSILLISLISSCGPDSDLVASGILHQCDINQFEKQLESDPNNEELHKQLKEKVEILKITIENEDEGNREALKEAIEEGTKDC